jgi:Tol biopolymer transport system component
MISTIVLLVVIILAVVVFFFKFSKQYKPTQSADVEPTSTPTTANEKPTLSTNGQLIGKLAFIRGDNLWFSNNGVEKQLTTDAIPTEIPYWTGLPKLWYSNPQISPDGKKIAYLKNTGTDARVLVVSDIDGKNTKQFANDVEWTMPIVQWSNDNQQIYYPSSGGMETITVRSVNITTGQKLDYGQFTMGSGCGGGSSDPADHVSAEENIISVGGGVQIFDISPQNNFIVHTILCTGGGLGILDLSTKQDKKIDDKAMRATISPDGKSIAAISGNSVVIFDTNGNVLKTYQTPNSPQILLWDDTGKVIYYSSAKLVKNLDFDEKLALDILGSSPTSYRVNAATLWKLALDNGKSEKIIDFDAHNVKPVFVANQKLLVVVVENATTLYDYINQYKIKDNMVKYYPKVKIAEVNLSGLTSTTLVDQVQQSSFLPQ